MPRKLETPGAAPAATTTTTQPAAGEDSAAAAATGGPAPDAFQANATALNPDPPAPAGEADLRAIVDAQAKQISALLGAVENMQRNQAAPANMPQSVVFPKLEDLDLTKLTSPTMTDKGWYVPPTFGAIPNGQKA